MNELQRTWFQELREQRAKAADALESFGLRGLKKGASDNYSDKAHFVYELLQNADDAGASSVTFHLCSDKLVFVHNGTRRFTISNPKTESEDKDRNRLGDVNSITAYHESTKSDDGLNSIGTFGIGFKAVYLYTREPIIYDGEINFAIEREMVPRVVDDDIPERGKGETAFVLPFNHPDVPASQAAKEIAAKLRGLSYPLFFLNNLRDIYIQVDASRGVQGYDSIYSKKVVSLGKSGDIFQERVELSHDFQKASDASSSETFIVFSRVISGGQRCSVGYLTDTEERLTKCDRPVFCFFPTHVKTNLGFVVQAPFQLTNSREVIVASEHNVGLIDSLAKLAADSLVCLKGLKNSKGSRLLDDGILAILPMKQYGYCYRDDDIDDDESLSTVSFQPFYKCMRDKFLYEKIFPTRNGYTDIVHAYWATTHEISELFDDSQLQMMTGDKKARWVFCSKPASNDDASSFVRGIVKVCVDDRALLQGIKSQFAAYAQSSYSGFGPISASFVESQSRKWLSKFYGWISETQRKTEAAKKLPILLDDTGKACRAYDSEGRREIYLPAAFSLKGSHVVADWILKDENGSKLAKAFDLCPPNEDDIVYRSIVLPLEASKDDDEVDEIQLTQRLRYLFKWLKEMPRSKKAAHRDLLDRLSDCYIIPVCYPDGTGSFYGKPNETYLPVDPLTTYFAQTEVAFFVDKERCAKILDSSWNSDVEAFLSDLGVATSLRFIEAELDWSEVTSREDIPKDRSTYYQKWIEPRMDGLEKVLQSISENHDKKRSIALWKILSSRANDLKGIFTGTYSYFFYNDRKKKFTSSSVTLLKEQPWLFDKKGEIKSPSNITVRELADVYESDTPAGKAVMSFLGIRTSNLETLVENGSLTDEDAKDIHLALLLRENGINGEDEILELLKIKEQREQKNAQRKSQAKSPTRDAMTADNFEAGAASDDRRERTECEPRNSSSFTTPQFDYDDADWHTFGTATVSQTRTSSNTRDNMTDNDARIQESEKDREAHAADHQQGFDTDTDDDVIEDVPFRAVNYERAVNRAQQTGERESQKAWSMKMLHDVATTSEKYSYSWFASLLRLESLANDDSHDSRAVSIRFGLVEPETGTKRTIILRQPSSYIPQRMEDLSDIPLVLHFANGDHRIIIEVASVLPDRLKVKVKDSASIRGIDFRKVIEASIDVQSPAFLLQSLITGFDALELSDAFDLKSGLGKNIEFVYGPPGTGKTTYLARRLLVPFMRRKEKPRVLVLAPTNKAADVLTSKVLEVIRGDRSWKRWLARFGVTADEQLETKGVFRDREFDFSKLDGTVGVTTIARFAYDYITVAGEKKQIQELDWDYIVVDEASMVPIANIAYLLYKAKPKKFIIAGDPYQIEPVDSGNFWQGENIYSMVGLKSFSNTHTEPHDYKVHALPIQYRSVPAIGEVVSKLTYDGGLKHNRSAKEQGVFSVAPRLDITALNIVRFPVSSYEGIYRAKRLGKSPYHIYSALLAYEFVKHLANKISTTNNGKKPRSIGVISPYRAQADLIESLLLQGDLPDDVQVLSGTIHSFQGDECDVIVAVFNPPMSIGANGQFLNKESIVNVAISRARDYLVLFVPDDATKGFAHLKRIKRLIRLCQYEGCWEYSSDEVEKALFGDAKYLEKNVFSTSHQSVNVYRQPERLYEVRVSDDAVDVQVRNG